MEKNKYENDERYLYKSEAQVKNLFCFPSAPEYRRGFLEL